MYHLTKKYIAVLMFLAVICFNCNSIAFANITNETVKNLNFKNANHQDVTLKNANNGTKSTVSYNKLDVTDIPKRSVNPEPNLLNIFSSLAMVILLIVATGWIYLKLSRISPESIFSGKFDKIDENKFKILSTVQLGSNKSLYLVEINKKQLIIGSTQGSINLLSELSSAEIKQVENSGETSIIHSVLGNNVINEFENSNENIQDEPFSDESIKLDIENSTIYKKYLH